MKMTLMNGTAVTTVNANQKENKMTEQEALNEYENNAYDLANDR